MTQRSSTQYKNLPATEFILLMAGITSLAAVSIDLVLPALGIMERTLSGATPENMPLIVSIFFAGIGIGQLIYGPICDSAGRRFAIFSGLTLFSIGTLICLFTENFYVLLIGRFIQAFGTSGPRIASLAIVRDQYSGNEMARILSFIMAVFICAPMVAPLIGQGIINIIDWHAIFIFLLIYGLCMMCWAYFRQAETLTPKNRKPLAIHLILNDFLNILKNKEVMLYTLANGANFCILITYVSLSQHIFQNIYQAGQHFPIYFSLIALAIGLAFFANGKLVRKLGMKKLIHMAMWFNLASSIIMLVIFFSTQGIPHIFIFIGLMIICFLGSGLLMGNLTALAMEPLGESAGSGAAIINSISTLVGVPVAIFISKILDKDLIPFSVGYVLISLLTILFLLIAEKVTQNKKCLNKN